MKQIATEQTLAFVKSNLTKNHLKILEVGCGNGYLAKSLLEVGFQVTAIDKEMDCVASAKALGIEAIQSDILDFNTDGLFDVVLFTRSLHHIGPLDKVLVKVKSLLCSTGKLLVEDFAFEKMDEKTANWFYEVKDLVDTLAGKSEEINPSLTPLTRWMKHHGQFASLHTGRDLAGSIERHVGTFYSETCPYLYRYFGDEAKGKIFEWESKLIERKEIQPIGLRIVAKTYFSYLK